MRIISGIYKGRRITPPATFRARPTTDFARENLFNILSVRYDMEDMDVLDLFSGTGSIGIEFLSRGAKVQMVDIEHSHVKFIKESLKLLEAENGWVMHASVKDFLKRSKRRYDIVFADPPYDLPWLDKIPEMLFTSGVLKNESLFILEHPKKYNFNSIPGFAEQRQYGSVNFSFFESNTKL